MADTYLLPNKQLAAALLSPLRMVLTILIVPAILLVAFCGVSLVMYYTVWDRSVLPLGALFESALQAVGEEGPLTHVAGLAEWITGTLNWSLPVAGVGEVAELPQGVLAGVDSVLGRLMSQAAVPLNVVILATQVFGLRLALLAGMGPLILLSFLFAHADGGAERLIRRACAGRESANLYHQAKSMQFAVTGLTLMTALSMPFHVNPIYTMLGAAIALFPLAWVQAAFYKKYR